MAAPAPEAATGAAAIPAASGTGASAAGASGASASVADQDPAAHAAARRVAEAGALLVMVAWAANFVVVKSAIASVPPVAFAFLRFALAGAVLLAVTRHREGSIAWPAGTGRSLFLLGGLGFGVYQILWATGLKVTPAGTSSLLIAAGPVFTALVSVAAGLERAHAARFIGAAIALAGVAMVAGAGGLQTGTGIGELLTVAAAASWGTYLALSAGLLRTMSPLRLSAWAILAGVAVLAIPGVVQLGDAGTAWVRPDALLALAYSSLVAGALCNVVLYRAVALMGASRIANYQFLVPVMALALAAAFQGDMVLPVQVAGGVAIVAGIVVGRRVPTGSAEPVELPPEWPLPEIP